MRNLKKVLALVLSLVMALSLVTVAGATGFSKATLESEGVSDAYLEAAQVVSGLGIYKGKDTESTGDVEFAPDDVFTREQLAGIAYRIATKDVDDAQVDLYAKYCDFADVPEGYWAAGYIGYCQNAQIVVGYDGYFNPKGEVSGYMVLCVLLRAAGYDAYDEFKGDGWEIKVASTSKSLGITDTVPGTVSLSDTVTRELACELIFQTLTKVEVVYQNALWNYRTTNDNQANVYTKVDYAMVGQPGYRDVTLGEKQFNLKLSEGEQDKWGNPSNVWYQDENGNSVWNGTTVDTLVCEIAEEPIAVYTTTVYECDVAEDCFDGKDTTATLYVNGKTPVTETYKIVATDTTTKVGGEGRLTKVYAKDNDHGVIVTMVDTFLAQVTDVKAHEDDAAGHLKTPATLVLDVYDYGTNYDQNSAKFYEDEPTSDYYVYNGSTDWEFSVGDMVLLNAYTTNVSADNNVTNVEQYAFTTSDVKFASGTKGEGAGYDVDSIVLADSITGKQTTVYNYASKHTVDGTDYTDALTLWLNQAKNDTSEHVWYFDTYGNIIGIADPAGTSNYGVITALRWSDSVSDGWTTASGRAVANITYTDGTKATEVVIDSLMVAAETVVASTSNDGTFTVSTGHTTGTSGTVNALVKANEATKPTAAPYIISLTPAFQNDTNTIMKAGTTKATNSIAVKANYEGSLYVSSYAANNSAATDDFDIITRNGQNGQLYQFVTQADGSVQAIEVTGLNGNKDTYNDNGVLTATGHAKFQGFNSDKISGTSSADDKSFVKTDTFISFTSGIKNTVTTILVDDNTQFLINGYGSTGSLTAFTGLANMNGDKLTLQAGTEIDWVDKDFDGIAEYVFAVGKLSGSTSYSLFYFTSETANQLDGTSYNRSSNSGVVTGYLDGVLTSVPIKDDNTSDSFVLYDEIVNSAEEYESYPGHLFAVKLQNGSITAAYNVSGSDPGDTEFLDKGVLVALSSLTTKIGETNNVNEGFKVNDSASEPDTNSVYKTGVTKAIVIEGGKLDYNTSSGVLETSEAITYTNTSGSTTTGSFSFSGAASALKCGSWVDLDASDCYVTIVYQDSDYNTTSNSDGSTNENNVALQVYITSKTITPLTPETNTGSVGNISGITKIVIPPAYSSRKVAYVSSLGDGIYAVDGDTSDELYLVFTVADKTTGSSETKNVRLTIYDSKGAVAYTAEFASEAGDYNRCIQFTFADSNETSTGSGNLLKGSYTYTITGRTLAASDVSESVTVVSGGYGSFTVGDDGTGVTGVKLTQNP